MIAIPFLPLNKALERIRTEAEADPGQWYVAESRESPVAYAWKHADGRTTLRVTRQLLPPYSADLVDTADALPTDLEIGPIQVDRAKRELVLELRPRTRRRTGDRCPRCGGRPMYGTRLFGDQQMCAPCTMQPQHLLSDERGGALLFTLLAVVTIGLLVGSALTFSGYVERTRYALLTTSATEQAAHAAIEVMTERVRAVAQDKLGDLTDADIATLNAARTSLPSPAGAPLDWAETGYRIVQVDDLEAIPDDAAPLDVWTHQPRLRYRSVPRPESSIAARTIHIEMRARATARRGARHTLTRTLAVSRVMPHQHALYHSGGTAELCASVTPLNTISGPVRLDAHALFDACTHPIHYSGTIAVRDAVTSPQPFLHQQQLPTGATPIATATRAGTAANPQVLLASTHGHLQLTPTWGSTFEATRTQTSDIAGTGECADRAGACGGNSFFSPAATLQRATTGASTAYAIACGAAYSHTSACVGPINAAISYRPWPFTSLPAAGRAAADPAAPTRLWRGFYPDGRKNTRCTATVGGHTYRTHRCPSNAYGYTVDLAALPALAGGVLAVRASTSGALAATAGATEVLLLRNGARLNGPLTIVSEIPVAIVGSLNTTPAAAWRGPPPLMIDAPHITVLPAEADEQLGLAPGAPGWAAVWDSVGHAASPTPSALPLTALSNTTIYGVLRSHTCSARGGLYFGGSWESTPATLGDWSRAALHVIGAIEAEDQTAASAAACRALGTTVPGPRGGLPADRTPAGGPISRSLVHDPRLLHAAFQIPGSWMSANIPTAGVPGANARTRARQAHAIGGTTLVRIAQETGRRAPRPAIPLPALPAIPLPPAPLP